MASMRTRPDSTVYPVYRLKQWSSFRMQLLWAYERQLGGLAPNQSDYPFQSALFVRKGSMRAGPSRELAREAAKGQWLVLGQGKRWQAFSEDCVVLSLGFRFQLPTGEAVYGSGLPACTEASRFPGLEAEARAVLRSMGEHVGLGYYLREQAVGLRDYLLVQNAFFRFLIEMAEMLSAEGVEAESMRIDNAYVLQAMQLIDHVPMGRRLEPKAVAREVGVSPTHLDRLMVAHTGHSVFQYMELRRMRIAQDALLADASSLKSIAYDLGFSSPSHFHSWFKRRSGQTPSDYRHQRV